MSDNPTPFDPRRIARRVILRVLTETGAQASESVLCMLQDIGEAYIGEGQRLAAEQMRERAAANMREAAVFARKRAGEYAASGRRDHADCCKAYAAAYEVGAGTILFLPLTPDEAPKEEQETPRNGTDIKEAPHADEAADSQAVPNRQD